MNQSHEARPITFKNLLGIGRLVPNLDCVAIWVRNIENGEAVAEFERRWWYACDSDTIFLAFITGRVFSQTAEWL